MAGVRDVLDIVTKVSLGLMISLFILAAVLLYQIEHRAIPQFAAATPDGALTSLEAQTEPNLLSSTILKWASKAAVAAYTFDFVNYNEQAQLARPYFTTAGWADYVQSLSGFIDTITKNQLIVNGVVSGAPVIHLQGQLPGHPYSWRIQIPFLVTYQSADKVSRVSYMVTMTIVRVPTWINPNGIGVDQFVMS